MIWWTIDQQRLADERNAIASIDEDWFENPAWSLDSNYQLTLIFDLVLPQRRFRLAMIYHNSFPASPPSVRPVGEPDRISSHQYGPGGELCLSIRSDNWSPDVTGAEMVRSAHTLLSVEAPNEHGHILPAPSAHNIPSAQLLRHAFARFYLGPTSRITLSSSDLMEAPTSVGIEYRLGHPSVAHLLNIGPHPDIDPLVASPTPHALRDVSLVYPGYFYAVDAPGTAVKQIRTVEQLSTIVGSRFSLSTESMWGCVIRTSDLEILLFTRIGGSNDIVLYETCHAPTDFRRSGSLCDVLTNKRVGVVGLGSLGSKLATSLARAGIGRFELVDGEILHSGNLERHDADWRDVGRHKSDLMAYRLRLIHPRVNAHSWRAALGAQISSQEAGNVHAALAGCDLLIDATADAEVFNHLAFIALQNNRTIVWGAVYAGGIGGEIARSRPNKDPSPYAIRQAMTQFYQTAEESPPFPAGTGYDGSSPHGEPMVATDADTSVFAAHLAAYAIDALVDHEPSTYPAPAYVVGLQNGWLFDGPFDTRPIDVDAPTRVPLRSQKVTDVDTDFLQDLIKTIPHENRHQQTDC